MAHTRKSVPKRRLPARQQVRKRVARERPAEGVARYVETLRRATPVDVMQMERQGVPGVVVKQLSEVIDMPQQRLYEIIGAPKATVERKASVNAAVTGTAGQSALGMLRLLAQARDIVARSTAREAKDFDVEKWLGVWIETPQPALGGRKPADMLDTPTGLAIVERTLGALESGSYL